MPITKRKPARKVKKKRACDIGPEVIDFGYHTALLSTFVPHDRTIGSPKQGFDFLQTNETGLRDEVRYNNRVNTLRNKLLLWD